MSILVKAKYKIIDRESMNRQPTELKPNKGATANDETATSHETSSNSAQQSCQNTNILKRQNQSKTIVTEHSVDDEDSDDNDSIRKRQRQD